MMVEWVWTDSVELMLRNSGFVGFSKNCVMTMPFPFAFGIIARDRFVQGY